MFSSVYLSRTNLCHVKIIFTISLSVWLSIYSLIFPPVDSGIEAELVRMKKLSVYVATWNVADERYPQLEHKDWMELFGLKGNDGRERQDLDIIVIGFQESKRKWKDDIQNQLSCRGYVLVDHSYLDTYLSVAATGHRSFIEVFVLVKLEHLPYVSNIDKASTKCGVWNVTANKGGVSVRAEIYSVQMVFVNVHLEPHEGEEHNKLRVMQFGRIIDHQTFTVYERKESSDEVLSSKYKILDHDYVFWLGDLNFRIESLTRDDLIDMVNRNDIHLILPYDELKQARDRGDIKEFEEGQIKFRPTFKYDKKTDDFDTSEKQRKPAYCDRILWFDHPDDHNAERSLLLRDESIHIDHKLEVRQNSYDSLHHFKTSDHKPVVSHFAITVYPLKQAVVFDDPCQWTARRPNSVSFTVHDSVRQSKNDWIGLYKKGFYDHNKDYESFVYVTLSPEKRGLAKFKKRNMDIRSGRYRLIYVTGNRDVLGMTEEFSVDEPSLKLGEGEGEGEVGLTDSDSDSSLYTTTSESESCDSDDSDGPRFAASLQRATVTHDSCTVDPLPKAAKMKQPKKGVRKLRCPQKSDLLIKKEKEREKNEKDLDGDIVKPDMDFEEFLEVKKFIYTSERFRNPESMAKRRLSVLKSRLSVEEPRHTSDVQLKTNSGMDEEERPSSQAAPTSPFPQKHTEL